MEVEDIANVAIQEDLDHGVDVTTVATIPEDAVATADFTAREAGVVAGLRVAEAVLSVVCTDEFEVERHVEDGDRVEAGQKLLSVTTRTRDLLTAERSALNLLCRLSGIATATRAWADALEGTKAQGARHPQDDAGAALPGEVRGPLRRRRQPPHVPVGRGAGQGQPRGRRGRRRRRPSRPSARCSPTCRSRSRSTPSTSSARSLDAGADLILLDNFTPAECEEAVALVAGRAAPGGLGPPHPRPTRRRTRRRASTTSPSGALTHSSPILDIGLDLRAAE